MIAIEKKQRIKINSTKIKPFTVVDLFCGAGGFSEGFKQAGFKIIAGIDNNAEALKTYKANFKESLAIQYDLSKDFDVKQNPFRDLADISIDVVIGGPPCQGFSIAGKRLADDPRNNLYRAYLHFIRVFHPRAIVVENVPTIKSLFGGRIAQAIINDFKEMGYHTTTFTLLASDYGVPQNRKRTFFVATKSNLFQIPAPTSLLNPITTEEALSDLPILNNQTGADELPYQAKPNTEYQRIMRQGSSRLFNHWAVIHKEDTVKIIRMVPDGGNYKDLPKKLWSTRKVNIAWTRMNSKKPCFTIDAGHNHHFHYKANRVPTVRECARIQSFPDGFRFFGNKTSQFRQVGNAVPPLLAKHIATALKNGLKAANV